jgi:hypothetical protein
VGILYLLVCLDGRSRSTQFLHVDVSNTRSNKALFAKLRAKYHSICRRLLAPSFLVLFKRNLICAIWVISKWKDRCLALYNERI